MDGAEVPRSQRPGEAAGTPPASRSICCGFSLGDPVGLTDHVAERPRNRAINGCSATIVNHAAPAGPNSIRSTGTYSGRQAPTCSISLHASLFSIQGAGVLQPRKADIRCLNKKSERNYLTKRN